MKQPELRWQEITGDHEALDQAYRLRVLAWRTQVALPSAMEIWKDQVDDESRHWACFDAGCLVAAVRLSLHPTVADMPHPEVYEDVFAERLPPPIAYYSRAAVHPTYRRRGLFSASHELCIREARSMGAACMVAVTGSVSGNRFTPTEFIKAGYTFVGDGRPYSQTPYLATHAPMIFLHTLGTGTAHASCTGLAEREAA